MAKKIGRRKGAKSKGYFYRPERGWFTKHNGKFVPLLGETGERIRDQRTAADILKEAYARYLLTKPVEPVIVRSDDAQVGEVCAKYLEHLKAEAGPIGPNPRGLAKTYVDRGQTLFDFCYGLPGEFFCDGDLKKREAKTGAEKKRIHDGYGPLLCSELTPAHIDEWLDCHSWKRGGRRTRVQAVKRAFNFGVERKMIPASPTRGYKVSKSLPRVTYLTPEQEALSRILCQRDFPWFAFSEASFAAFVPRT